MSGYGEEVPSGLPLSSGELPDDRGQKITVRVKDRKDVEVRAVFAWDQVS